MRMQIARALMVFAGTVCLAGAGHAAFVGTGLAYGGNPSGGTVICRLFNVGASSLTVTNRQVFDNTSSSVTLTSDTCNVALGAGGACAYSANASGNLAFACRVGTSAAATNLTGIIEIHASNNAVIVSSPLQK